MKPFDQAVYTAIQDLGGAYTIAIHTRLEEQQQRGLSIGALFCAIDRLEEAGYIRTQEEEGGPERGYRKRRYCYVARPLEWQP